MACGRPWLLHWRTGTVVDLARHNPILAPPNLARLMTDLDTLCPERLMPPGCPQNLKETHVKTNHAQNGFSIFVYSSTLLRHQKPFLLTVTHFCMWFVCAHGGPPGTKVCNCQQLRRWLTKLPVATGFLFHAARAKFLGSRNVSELPVRERIDPIWWTCMMRDRNRLADTRRRLSSGPYCS